VSKAVGVIIGEQYVERYAHFVLVTKERNTEYAATDSWKAWAHLWAFVSDHPEPIRQRIVQRFRQLLQEHKGKLEEELEIEYYDEDSALSEIEAAQIAVRNRSLELYIKVLILKMAIADVYYELNLPPFTRRIQAFEEVAVADDIG